jgi:CheY-like chemotaxis protein
VPLESVPTALVVEDDREWQRILRDELLSAGFKIDWAWGREEALRKVAAPPFKYDVVFLDPNLDDSLEGLSGVAVAEQLGAREPGASVVLVSGFAPADALSRQYAQTDVTLHGIFEKREFDLTAFRHLLLDLRGVEHASESLFRCDREALARAWELVKADGSSSEKGETLEAFAIDLLSGISLLEFIESRARTTTGEIDAVFSVAAIAGTLCQEWGGHLLVECRNRKKKFDAAAVRDFAQILGDADAKVGIVVSLAGLTGDAKSDARGQIGNVFLTERRVIITLDERDVVDVIEGANLYDMLHERDIAVRLGR